MIWNESLRRKVIYIAAICVLLFPLYQIGTPAMRTDEDRMTAGGVLANLRTENDLSPAMLGEIDPASEVMKLATLGMRGIACTLLWERAIRYKRVHDWDNLTATLQPLTSLQPNFISVWQYQGWNLAYNVSVEFDDYRSRYLWVKRGINFLRDGLKHNSEEPVLPWELGWTFGHKIGKADEYIQYRRLYRDDEAFHEDLATDIDMDSARGPVKEGGEKPDNWLTGREWFLRGQRIVDSGVPIRGRLVDDTDRIRRGKTPLIFHSHPPKWLMNFATAIEEEGIFDDKAREYWRRSGAEWLDYGRREIPTSYGFAIRLEDYEKVKEDEDRVAREIDEKLPEVRAEIEREKRAALSPEELQALDVPADQRTEQQASLALAAERKSRARYREIADRAPDDVKREIERLVIQGEIYQTIADAIFSYRDQVNYDYWKLRCEVEQTDEALKGRELVWDAKQAYEQSDLEKMKTLYEQAWDKWAKIFAEHPILMEDTTAEDLVEDIQRYAWVLSQLEEPFPTDFKLNRLLEIQQAALEEEAEF